MSVTIGNQSLKNLKQPATKQSCRIPSALQHTDTVPHLTCSIIPAENKL